MGILIRWLLLSLLVVGRHQADALSFGSAGKYGDNEFPVESYEPNSAGFGTEYGSSWSTGPFGDGLTSNAVKPQVESGYQPQQPPVAQPPQQPSVPSYPPQQQPSVPSYPPQQQPSVPSYPPQQPKVPSYPPQQPKVPSYPPQQPKVPSYPPQQQRYMPKQPRPQQPKVPSYPPQQPRPQQLRYTPQQPRPQQPKVPSYPPQQPRPQQHGYKKHPSSRGVAPQTDSSRFSLGYQSERVNQHESNPDQPWAGYSNTRSPSKTDFN